MLKYFKYELPCNFEGCIFFLCFIAASFIDYPVHLLQSICLLFSFRMIKSHSSAGLGPFLAYRRLFLVLSTAFSILWPSTSAVCYYPNGNFAGETYLPCNPDDEHTMCCYPSGDQARSCRSDGLCYHIPSDTVWRRSCTDRTWKSSKCIKLYVSGIGMQNCLYNPKI